MGCPALSRRAPEITIGAIANATKKDNMRAHSARMIDCVTKTNLPIELLQKNEVVIRDLLPFDLHRGLVPLSRNDDPIPNFR